MKKIILLLLSACISTSVIAAPPVAHQFTNGTTIEASQVNANYQELADRIEVLQNQINTMQSNAQKSLVGFTTALSSNDNGEFTKLSQLCYAEFSDSRICNTKEVRETVNPPVLGSSERAWVMPAGVIANSGASPSVLQIIDSITSMNFPNCLSLNSSGRTFGACSTSTSPDQNRVACCR